MTAGAFLWGGSYGGGYWMWGWYGLTSEERDEISFMTNEERTEYFENKRAERDVQRESHRAVMDKLLNQEELTAEEQEILDEIKTFRSQRELNWGFWREKWQRGWRWWFGWCRGGY